jgi:hypothetical protein
MTVDSSGAGRLLLQDRKREFDSIPTRTLLALRDWLLRKRGELEETGDPSVLPTLDDLEIDIDAIDALLEFRQGVVKTVPAPDQAPFVKADHWRRRVLMPVYHRFTPNDPDSHGEFVDASDLETALEAFAEQSMATGRRINVGHKKDQYAGKWLSLFPWPFELTVPMTKADGSTRSVTYPAGTWFAWIEVDAAYWPDVLAGKLAGISIGGTAARKVIEVEEQ